MKQYEFKYEFLNKDGLIEHATHLETACNQTEAEEFAIIEITKKGHEPFNIISINEVC